MNLSVPGRAWCLASRAALRHNDFYAHFPVLLKSHSVYAIFGGGAWNINIEALCAAPPEALSHSPSQMPLSCLVAPLSKRELHKGGGGGGEARRARAARAPKANSCATSCGTPSATPSATSCATSLTCSSFTCRQRKAWGAVEDGAYHAECLYASVLRGARYVLRRVLRHVLRHILR